MPIPLILGAAALPSVVKGISGLFGIAKGNKMAKNNPFPTAQVNSNIQKNLAIAEGMAQTGLPQQQYNNSLQNIQRNQASVLNTLGRSSNNNAGLQSLLRASNDATMNLDVNDAQARLQNQRLAMQSRGQLANEENRVWDWNNRQKYIQNANAASQTIANGKTNAFGALTDLSQLGQSYLDGMNGLGGAAGTSQTGNMLPNNLYPAPNLMRPYSSPQIKY